MERKGKTGHRSSSSLEISWPISSHSDFQVNDESVETMSTPDIIDLLRKIRGSICIRVHRKNKAKTSVASNELWDGSCGPPLSLAILFLILNNQNLNLLFIFIFVLSFSCRLLMVILKSWRCWRLRNSCFVFGVIGKRIFSQQFESLHTEHRHNIHLTF